MDTQEIQSRASKVLAHQAGCAMADVKPESHLEGDLRMDSLDNVEAVMALEDEFGIEIPDEPAQSWTTVQDVYTYLESRKNELR